MANDFFSVALDLSYYAFNVIHEVQMNIHLFVGLSLVFLFSSMTILT